MNTIEETIRRQKLSFITNVMNNDKCRKILEKIGEIYNKNTDTRINQSKISKSSIIDFMKVTKLERFNLNEMRIVANNEHTTSTVKYEKLIIDNEIIEIRRRLISNNQIDRDLINNILLPDELREHFRRQATECLDLSIANLFNQ